MPRWPKYFVMGAIAVLVTRALVVFDPDEIADPTEIGGVILVMFLALILFDHAFFVWGKRGRK